MTTWEAILKVVEPFQPGYEFGKYKKGFLYLNDEGEWKKAGIVEMVRRYTNPLMSDENIARRMREFNHGDYDLISGSVFRWEVVKGKRGWYRILENQQSRSKNIILIRADYMQVAERIIFTPVERNGMLYLF
jgi:hypothetical protein